MNEFAGAYGDARRAAAVARIRQRRAGEVAAHSAAGEGAGREALTALASRYSRAIRNPLRNGGGSVLRMNARMHDEANPAPSPLACSLRGRIVRLFEM